MSNVDPKRVPSAAEIMEFNEAARKLCVQHGMDGALLILTTNKVDTIVAGHHRNEAGAEMNAILIKWLRVMWDRLGRSNNNLTNPVLDAMPKGGRVGEG